MLTGELTATRPDACYIAYPICPPHPGAHADADGALALILGPLRAAARGDNLVGLMSG